MTDTDGRLVAALVKIGASSPAMSLHPLSRAGPLGFLFRSKRPNYRAQIWDLSNREALGEDNVRATGASYRPALLLPVPDVAPTDSAARKVVAEWLSDLIRPD